MKACAVRALHDMAYARARIKRRELGQHASICCSINPFHCWGEAEAVACRHISLSML